MAEITIIHDKLSNIITANWNFWLNLKKKLMKSKYSYEKKQKTRETEILLGSRIITNSEIN